MFDKMRESKKAWKWLRDWLKHNHNYYFCRDGLNLFILNNEIKQKMSISNISILMLIPLFLQENKVYIDYYHYYDEVFDRIKYTDFSARNKEKTSLVIRDKDFISGMQKVCESGIEFLEEMITK